MTTLYISHIETHTDDLGRFVTTLTQEIMSKINEHEEQILLGVIKEMDEIEGVVECCNSDYTEFDVFGNAVKKAINTINAIAGVIYLAPITEINEGWLYRVEIEY